MKKTQCVLKVQGLTKTDQGWFDHLLVMMISMHSPVLFPLDHSLFLHCWLTDFCWFFLQQTRPPFLFLTLVSCYLFFLFILPLHFLQMVPKPSPNLTLLFFSRIQPLVPVPEPLTGVPSVSSSDQCSPVCSPACFSGCAASPTHGPGPLQRSDTQRNEGIKCWLVS